MRLVRAGLVIGAAVVVLVAAACGFAAWLLMTESGTAWLVARVEGRVPASISIGRIGGTVWDGLAFADVVVTTDTARVEVDAAELELALDALLDRRLVADRLTVGAVRYVSLDAPDAGPRGAVDIPIEIAVVAGTVESFTLTLGATERVLGPAELVARMAGNRIVVEELAGEAIGFVLQAAGTIVLGESIELDSTFEWSTMRNGLEYAGRGDAVGAWPTLRIHQDITAPAALVADGEVVLGAEPTADLELSWTDLEWPWASEVRSARGRARVAGWLDLATFDGDASVSVDGIDADVVANGAATLTEIRFDGLDAVSAYGRATGSGRVGFAPIVWDFDLRAEGVDPSVRFSEWPGALDVVGRLSGHMQPELGIGLADATVSGSLRDLPIAATGSVDFDAPSAWQFATVDADIAGNRLQIDGTFADAIDLRLRADARDLAALLDEISGSLTVDGVLTGTRQAPAFRGAVSGSDLARGAFGARSLTLNGEIVADQARTVSVDLEASGVQLGDRAVQSVVGRVRGTAADHVVELDANAEYGDATLRASGEWSDQTWSGVLASLSVREPTLGQWQLDSPAGVTASRTSLTLDRACVNQGAASLCGTVRMGTADDMLEVALRAFDLAVLADVLPPGVAMTGVYDADLALAGPLRRPAGQFSTRGTNSVITIREPDQPPLEIVIESLRADATLTQEGELNVEAAFDSSNGGRFEANATAAALWSDAPTVAGEVTGRWPDLAFLSLLSPDVGEVSGSGSVDLSFDGPLRDPEMRGSAQWIDGRVVVPRFGLVMENIQTTLASSDNTALSIDASAAVGTGQLSIVGTTQLDAEAGWPTQLRIFGERLEAVRLPEAQILITPALAVDAALPNINVSGAFLIPEARLTLDELPPQAAVPSPDTVVHDIERPEGPRPLNVHADIRVGLGENVRYTGAGLDVGLAGAMGVTYQSGDAAVASGAVTLSGQYQAYGQTLEIEDGRLLFTGPIANPNLDVRAIRKIEATIAGGEETTVGIELTGTVEAPVSRVFSQPTMNEADALAYLLLGRPLSATGDEETASLESAAFAMGLQQALPVIQRVGESLGLDEFSVQTTSTDTGELMAGKRLSPRLYIRYSYGLFNRIGGLLMRFNLNNRFSLETRSGDYRSMDLIYTVERD